MFLSFFLSLPVLVIKELLGMASSTSITLAADKLVAVVGAGAAGLACASRLAEHGVPVTVFDSGRGPGGRMSQRREKASDGKIFYFDHGAQYFTVKDPMVQVLVDSWEAAGIVADWKGKFGTYDADTKNFIEDTDLFRKRYVGVPGMNAICQAFSQQPGVQVKCSVTVAKLDWMEEQKLWMLADKDGRKLGEFWAVVATDKNLASPRFLIQNGIPPPLSGAGIPSLTDKVAGVTSSSSFVCMLAFPKHLTSIPFDGFTIVGSKVLAWAARDSSKPKRDKLSGECWVLQSTAEYAQQVIEKAGIAKPSEELLSTVTHTLLEHFRAIIGETPAPLFAKSHRWGSAFPKSSIATEERCLADEVRRMAVCGDFCIGPTVECSILSGISAAEKIWGLTQSKA